MLDAARMSCCNRTALARVRVAGCYFCLCSFAPREVTRWADDGSTALCPRCGADAVLPGVSDRRELAAAREGCLGPQADAQDTVPGFLPRHLA